MKKLVLFTITLIGFFTAGAFALDHSQMHEMMMKQGGQKTDSRTELKMPEPMKVMHKEIMRKHMDTVSEITAALAGNELERAAAIATKDLGWSDMQEKMCAMFGDSAGNKDFFALGKAMHTKADDLADAAVKGDRDKALTDLSQLVKKCNACHERFRH
jgi:cytochrome c556